MGTLQMSLRVTSSITLYDIRTKKSPNENCRKKWKKLPCIPAGEIFCVFDIMIIFPNFFKIKDSLIIQLLDGCGKKWS